MESETKTQKHKMEAKTATPPAEKEYLDFEPSMEWAWEDKWGTVLLFLPGFNKQQLRVQVTSSGMLRLSGERPLGGQRWNRFFKEVQIPKNCNSNAITARFEDNILYVQLPKITEQQVTNVNPNPQVQPQPQPQPPPPKQSQRPASQTDVPMEPAKQPQKRAPSEPPSGKLPPPQIPTNEQQSKGGEPKKEAQVQAQDQAAKRKPADEANPSTPDPKKENPKTNPADGKALGKEGDELGAPSREIRGGKVGDSTENDTKLEQEANSVASGSAKSTLEGYNKVVGSMARDLRRGGKLFNLVVTVLLALLLGLYFGTMTKSSEKPNI